MNYGTEDPPHSYAIIFNASTDNALHLRSGQTLCTVKSLEQAPIVSFVHRKKQPSGVSAYSPEADQEPEEWWQEPPENNVEIDSGVVNDGDLILSKEERRAKVKQLLESEFNHIHPWAKELLIEFPETVHIPNVPFRGITSLTHHIKYQGPIFFRNNTKYTS